ncbi:MAG: RNase adapter RapZ [Xanthomonadales bacterium]|nr:RNase adapter RapZ [Xanthomonadales bacterium]ODU93757.1 MAG: RNase adaptor protein RapZ [Rhodanobacter sp. SCN 66-43]OJY83279.1 MAG: RNase adaptor protein RapZ [Xanthomonadales bacterium 66-474]
MTATDSTATQSSVPMVVLSGLSGAGKTVALRSFEDLGFYCVDNLPTSLLPSLYRALTDGGRGTLSGIAVGVDVRNQGDLERMPEALSKLAEAGADAELVFLDSSDAVLLKRYAYSRRRHPLSENGRSLIDALAEERRRLRPLRAIANRSIDTSDTNVHQLRRLIATQYGAATEGLTLMFESFAYGRGLPADCDFVFDARCLPNPHWDARLRPFSGQDAPVREFLDGQELVVQYLADVRRFLDAWLPRFENEGKGYLTVAIGCTGGRHRSVYLAERLAEHYRADREQVLTFHRELE